MNLFREVRRRRSSSANEEGGEPPTKDSSNSHSANATPNNNTHASLRRGFMTLTRSRTTTNDLCGGIKARGGGSSSNSAGTSQPSNQNGSLSASATADSITKVTDWSYCKPPQTPNPQPPPPTTLIGMARPPNNGFPTRPTSLNRNFGHSRSITMPNFQEANGQTETYRHFSTFRQQQTHKDRVMEDSSNTDTVVRYRQPGPNGGNRGQRGTRPLSADISSSGTRVLPPHATIIGQDRKNGPLLPTSNSEFFRVVQDRLREVQSDNTSRDSSLESLLDDDGNYIVTTCVDSMESHSFLNLLNEADEDALERQTSIRSSSGRGGGVGGKSVDLLDNHLVDNNLLSVFNRAKTNSLPKTAFGSIQLKVQEIREQLDVLKTSASSTGGTPTTSSTLKRVLPAVIQQPQKSALHLFGIQANPSFHHSPNGSSQESMSPSRSNSPSTNRMSTGSSVATTASNNTNSSNPTINIKISSGNSGNNNNNNSSNNSHQQLQQQQQQQQPHLQLHHHQGLPSSLSSQAILSNSSSPSTLSPCSSNSIPSSSTNGVGLTGSNVAVGGSTTSTLARPQVLRLPQSNSFNCFTTAVDPPPTSGGGSDKLIFFFDIMNTQERIAKVNIGMHLH